MRRLAILCACWIYLADITVTQRTPAAGNYFMSRDMTKPTKCLCRPAKTQISLRIRPV